MCHLKWWFVQLHLVISYFFAFLRVFDLVLWINLIKLLIVDRSQKVESLEQQSRHGIRCGG